ncbi:MAG: FkbM family methyltransferase [Candidatus Lokiarchaeia archaeon]
MHFHNFILKFIRGVNTKIIGKLKSNYFIIFNDIKFIVRNPLIYYNLIRYGEYEPASSYIFKKLIKRDMTVIDIGGNIGYFSLMASKLVGIHGKVYVFEPDRTSFMFLKKNIKINKVRNIISINKCVSNEEGIIKLYHHPKFHSCHSIFKSISKKLMKQIDVESITLDNMFLNEDFRISFIKMDIEGAEINALKGMGKMLEKNKVSYLLTECNLRILKSTGKNAQHFIMELDKYFNKYYVILDDKNLKFESFNDRDILIRFLDSLSQNNLNILCIKKPN